MSVAVGSQPSLPLGTPRRGSGLLVPLPAQTQRTPREAALLVAKMNGKLPEMKTNKDTLRRSFTQMDFPTNNGRKYRYGQVSFDMPMTVLSARGPGAACGDGRVDPVAHAVAHRVPSRDLHGAIGNYSTCTPRRLLSRDSLRTSYNNKAKEGYKYWYMERPRPTSFGKYGIGSYKTVLGLGSAPRT